MTTIQAPIVVTGAASGIGAALRAQLIDAGRSVIGLDRHEGPGILACDLADADAISRFAAELDGPVGGLANVAGVPGTASPETVLLVNVLAPRVLAAALLDKLAPGSAVVNVASVAANRNTQPPEAVAELVAARDGIDVLDWLTRHPLDGTAAYDTSKRVLVDWSRGYSGELQKHHVRCLSVSPGPVETPILVDFTQTMGADSMSRAESVVGRHGRPEEIAAVVAFALSPQASWLNGIDIPVEGGLLAARPATTQAPTKEGADDE